MNSLPDDVPSLARDIQRLSPEGRQDLSSVVALAERNEFLFCGLVRRMHRGEITHGDVADEARRWLERNSD